MQKFSEIYYNFADTSVGKLLVASNDSGICFVEIGDAEEGMALELKKKFADAKLAKDVTMANKVAQMIENPEAPSAVKTSQSGTAFQQKVWSELQKIPMGEVISYSQLAARIDKPKAVRAVANACARNDVAIVIPCHRVIGSNGSLTGYRWGVDKKKMLLERERNARK